MNTYYIQQTRLSRRVYRLAINVAVEESVKRLQGIPECTSRASAEMETKCPRAEL